MQILDIVKIAVNIAGALVWLVAIILTLKARSGSKNAQIALKPLKLTAEVLSKIPEYINQAESMFGSGTGSAKLGWVVQQVFIDCIRSGMNPDIEVDRLTEYIETILSTPQKKITEVIDNA